MNFALRLMYNGTNYHGWQIQPNDASVCATLQSAIRETVGHDVKLIGCGRTDAGVHAKTYVANFRSDTKIPIEKLPFAINMRLPEDISVQCAAYVSEDFHAIHSCVKKEYTYQIYNDRVKNPFMHNRAMFYACPLDEKIMQRAAEKFIGTHDFEAMRSVGTDVKSTVRTVYDCNVIRDGKMIYITISADGFLYNMARTIVGTILYAAEEKFSPDYISEILMSKDRSLAGPCVPACGLYMTGVWYDEQI